MLIDGKRVEARSGKTLLVEDPATEEIIAHVPAGDKEDIDLAVAATRRAINSSLWARIKPRDRSRLVWQLGDGRPLRSGTPSAPLPRLRRCGGS